MTVRELREILENLENQEAIVIVAGTEKLTNPHVETDPEGNVYIGHGDISYYETPGGMKL